LVLEVSTIGDDAIEFLVVEAESACVVDASNLRAAEPATACRRGGAIAEYLAAICDRLRDMPPANRFVRFGEAIKRSLAERVARVERITESFLFCWTKVGVNCCPSSVTTTSTFALHPGFAHTQVEANRPKGDTVKHGLRSFGRESDNAGANFVFPARELTKLAGLHQFAHEIAHTFWLDASDGYPVTTVGGVGRRGLRHGRRDCESASEEAGGKPKGNPYHRFFLFLFMSIYTLIPPLLTMIPVQRRAHKQIAIASIAARLDQVDLATSTTCDSLISIFLCTTG